MAISLNVEYPQLLMEPLRMLNIEQNSHPLKWTKQVFVSKFRNATHYNNVLNKMDNSARSKINCLFDNTSSNVKRSYAFEIVSYIFSFTYIKANFVILTKNGMLLDPFHYAKSSLIWVIKFLLKILLNIMFLHRF